MNLETRELSPGLQGATITSAPGFNLVPESIGLAWAEIDLGAIRHNVQEIRRVVGSEVFLAAVVKADAYGHGAAAIARVALEAGAVRLAVAQPAEGLSLRRAGLSAPILILGPTPPWQARLVVEHNLTPTVNAWETAQALAAVADALGVTLPIHLKVDTGMGRYGLLPDEVVPFAQAVSALPGLRLEGLWTHFATADEADPSYTNQQLGLFMDVWARLKGAGIDIPLRHAANSAAAICYPSTRLEMVRCGLAIYGLYPGDKARSLVDLRPAMSLKSRIARLRTLPSGSAISYGRTYITTQPTKVAFIPIGYADGLRRALSNKGSVLIRGRRAPIIGRVCMDGCMADVSHIPGVEEGDEAVFLGRQGQEQITADEMAGLLDTISYEVVTCIGPRVPRVYVG